MVILIRSNDLVLLSLSESILTGAGVACFVADSYMSALEGSIGAFPRRLMVHPDLERQARRLLTDAGLEAELQPAPGRG